MPLKPHSKAWYNRLARMQRGYYYPWKSKLLPFNGEDIYLEVVRRHLSPEKDVLDVACGHGELALEFGPLCRNMLAYDRIPEYIDMARRTAQEQGVNNVTFLCADSSSEANGGEPRVPAADNSLDLIISRRGPLHWIADVRRIARPGAMLIELNPDFGVRPPWLDDLPHRFRWQTYDYGGWHKEIGRRLAEVGLTFHSTWAFHGPEYFEKMEEFYKKLTWGYTADEVPSFDELRPTLEKIFSRYGRQDGLAVPHGRFLWMAEVR